MLYNPIHYLDTAELSPLLDMCGAICTYILNSAVHWNSLLMSQGCMGSSEQDFDPLSPTVYILYNIYSKLECMCFVFLNNIHSIL